MSGSHLRSPIRYYGGKGKMIDKLTRHVPPGGRPYCEPFCGGASLFFSRERAPSEVLNDLHGDVVNVYRVLQNRDTFNELYHRLQWTPYARAEFARAVEILHNGEADPITRAWAFFVGHNQGFAGQCNSKGCWGRTLCTSGASSWVMRQTMLSAWHHRLAGVQIDAVDAIQCIKYWDSVETIFYCDPPYVSHTRAAGSRNAYDHEMDDAHHTSFVQAILVAEGAVVVSGYHHPIYDALTAAGWVRHDYRTACHAAGRHRGSRIRGKGAALEHAARVECVWMNPRAARLMEGR